MTRLIRVSQEVLEALRAERRPEERNYNAAIRRLLDRYAVRKERLT
jgi:hypothetical protein